jgi:arginine-glutamic acid dipeptide repeat-containing protein
MEFVVLRRGKLIIQPGPFRFIKILSRGEMNSCSRCDLIFRPLPDSKLARRREERQKRAADTPVPVKVKEEVKDRDEKCAGSSIWSSAPKKLPQVRSRLVSLSSRDL